MRRLKLLRYFIAAILIISPLFVCSAMEGDINSDENVDLADAMLSLKVQAGQSTGESLDLSEEIDGDGRIGMAEALYALREVSGIDSPPVMDIKPASLYFSIDYTQKTITIFNKAGGQLAWSIDDTSLPSWITSVNPVSGNLAGGGSESVTITVDRTGLDPGLSYTATIPAASNGGNMDIELTLGFENGWSRSIGMGDEYAEYHSDSIQQTLDGGYIFVFENIYGGAGGYDYGIAKLAADGSLQWTRDFGGSSIEAPKAVIQTADQGYLVAGQSYSYRTGTRYCDIVVLKLDAAGGLEWQKNYGGTGYDENPYSLEIGLDSQGSPDGYILAGATTSFGAGGRDIWLLRLENNGDVRWQKTLGGSGNEYARVIHPINDGFWLAASTASFGAGGSDVWIVKLDADGSALWERAYGGTGSDSPVGIEPTDTGGCVVGAGTSSFLLVNNFWAFEIDASGALQWQYLYGGADNDYARDLRSTPDGGYIMTGWTYSFGEEFYGSISNDAWLVKLNAAGGIEWQKNYNKPFEYDGEIINAPDWAYSVTPTLDGGYAVVGDTDWNDIERNSDVWIFKVNSAGELGCGIDADSDAVPDNSGSVTITGPNAYTVTDTSVVPGTPDGQFFTITPEEFIHRVTGITIVPAMPYSGYVSGSTMEWPEGGFSNQLSVRASFSDGSVIDNYTASVTWSSDNSAAGVTSTGLLTSTGITDDTTVVITATAGSFSAMLTVNIIDGSLSTASIISDNNGDLIHDGDYSVTVGETEQWRFLVENINGGILFDLTRDATWTSDDEELIIIQNNGEAGKITRLAPGAAVIFGEIDSVQTNVVAN